MQNVSSLLTWDQVYAECIFLVDLGSSVCRMYLPCKLGIKCKQNVSSSSTWDQVQAECIFLVNDILCYPILLTKELALVSTPAPSILNDASEALVCPRYETITSRD